MQIHSQRHRQHNDFQHQLGPDHALQAENRVVDHVRNRGPTCIRAALVLFHGAFLEVSIRYAVYTIGLIEGRKGGFWLSIDNTTPTATKLDRLWPAFYNEEKASEKYGGQS